MLCCVSLQGSYFETQSVLGNLLSMTSIPASFLDGSNVQSGSSVPWTSLRGFPKAITRDDLSRLEVTLNINTILILNNT